MFFNINKTTVNVNTVMNYIIIRQETSKIKQARYYPSCMLNRNLIIEIIPYLRKGNTAMFALNDNHTLFIVLEILNNMW